MATLNTHRPGPASAPTDMTEHRNVSVLFADLVGSTGHMEALGAEEYAEFLRSFHTVCNDAVRRHGGVVAQYQGDGIICYFGYPNAAEDDAARAVETALDILEGLGEQSGASRHRLETRIGISSGNAMFHGGEDHFGATAVGRCINRAARLEALAEPGSILICDDTRRLVGDLFHLRDVGEVELKGFASPQAVFRVEQRRRGITSRFEALRGRRKSPLIGRDAELNRLLDHFSGARHDGGRMVVVSAEAGFGKSRLLRALQEHPQSEGTTTFILQCSPEHGATPLHPVRSYLEWVAGVGAADDADSTHAKLKRLFSAIWGASDEDLATLLDLISPLGSGMQADQSESVPLRRQKAFQLLSQMIFRTVPKDRAVLVVFEDAHWIDPSTADFLQFMNAEVASHPALVLVTTRPEPPFQDGVPGAVDLIGLNRLDEDQALELAKSTLGDADFDDSELRLVIEKSDGVPLFLEEYSDVLVDAGAEAFSQHRVPLTLGGLVQGKLDRLSRDVQRFVRAASAVGRSFDMELICKIAQIDPATGPEMSAALRDLRLLEGTPRANRELTFAHALIRDAIYVSMNRNQQRVLHNAIAEHHISEGGDMSIAEHILAEHLAQANRPAEAIERFLNAALEAAGSGAAGEALAHLGNAASSLENLPEGADRDLLELRIRAIRGPTQMVTRGPGNPDFGATQSRAMDLVERLGLHSTMIPVIYNTALHAWATADLDRAMTIAGSIRMIDEKTPSDAAFMAANTMRGLIAWHQGHNDVAMECLGNTVSRHDPEMHHDLYSIFLKEFGVFSLFYLGLTHAVTGDPSRAADCAQRAYDLGEKMGFPHARGFGMLARFNTAMLRGDVQLADHYSAEALEFSTRQGFPEFMAMARFVQGWVAVQRGNTQSGLTEMLSGFDTWAATGFTCWQSLFAAMTAQVQIDVGDLQAAETLLTKYEDLIARTGEDQTKSPLQTARALLLRAKGDEAAAAEMAALARTTAAGQGAALWTQLVDRHFPV